MKARLLFLVLMILCHLTNGAQDYATAEIKPSLLDHAVAVLRDYESTFTVYSEKHAVLQIRYAITVINSSGNNYAEFTEMYDNARIFLLLGGNIYNAGGKLLYKIKKSDFKDYSAVAGYELYSEARMLHYKPAVNTYPYTVEYFYEISYDGLMNYPVMMPQNRYYLSVEHALFRVIVPEDQPLRYKELNLDQPVTIIPGKTTNTYEWQINDLNAVEPEPYGPEVLEYLPMVLTAPGDFEYEGFKGNMSNWENLGLWTYNLLKGRDELLPVTIAKIRALVAECKNKTDSIIKVYKYVQSRTRYVSISLGIGGFQPMTAEKVDEVGYGDCKALTNYTRALLQAAGIESYFTVVRAGKNERDLVIDFPSQQFNHAMLCVPVKGDTIWLECTSQTDPPGYTGNFTDDRHVLLITDQGGRIVRTNTYKQSENKQVRKTEIFTGASGTAKTDIHTDYSGLQYDNISKVLTKSFDDQKKWYYDELPLTNYSITAIEHSVDKGLVPMAHEHLELTLNAYASASGKRMYVPLNLMNRMTSLPKPVRERKTDVVIKKPFFDTDTVIIHIPPSYDIEYLPGDVTYSSPFGEYAFQTRHQEEQITVVRTLKVNKISSPPSTYEELLKFLKNICDADKSKAVLIKTM
jgi:transglutaminase-like putative cysteine protease